MKRLSMLIFAVVCMLVMAMTANAGGEMDAMGISAYGFDTMTLAGTVNVPVSLNDYRIRKDSTSVAYGVDMDYCVDPTGQQVKVVSTDTTHYMDVRVPLLTPLNMASAKIFTRTIDEDSGIVSLDFSEAYVRPNPVIKTIALFVGYSYCYTPDPERAYYDENLQKHVCGATPQPQCYENISITGPGYIYMDYHRTVVGTLR